MNMYIHELKASRKSTITWAITLIGVLTLYMSFYSTINNDADTFIKILEGVPPVVKQAIGLAVNQVTSPLGYYSFVYTFLMVLAAVQALNLGLNIISKEFRNKTADFLLTKPRTRPSVMTAKLLAGVTALIITACIYVVYSAIFVQMVVGQSFNMNALLLISFSLLILQFIFYALGFLIAVIFPKIKSVISVSLPIVFGFYFVNILASITGDQLYEYLSVFKYFDPNYIVLNMRYETKYVILSMLIVIICFALSYIVYSKKDVHAV